MFKNHIKFAFRLFVKDGVYSILNILGLCLGTTASIILFLYLQNELGYDKHHEKYSHIYRFTNHMIAEGAEFNVARTSRELAPLLAADFPEIVKTVRFVEFNDALVSYASPSGEKVEFLEENIWRTDSTIFDVFTHPFLEGNSKTALVNPKSIVLTQRIAKKYFGNSPALGNSLAIANERYEVTGVIDDLPTNSHLKFDLLMSEISTRQWLLDRADSPERVSEGFWNPDGYTYFLMREGYERDDFSQHFDFIYEKHYKAFGNQIGGRVIFKLQTLEEAHFEVTLNADEPHGNKVYLMAFTVVGIFIIVLACINYMNMATARSTVRTGEMAIRKVLGFTKWKLFWSVLLEAYIQVLISLIFGVIFSYIILEFSGFNDLIFKDLSIDFIDNTPLVLGLLIIAVVIGLLSGVYPALYIPNVPIVSALKAFKSRKEGAFSRKGLIIIQFIISMFVIISTVLMSRQLDHVRKQNLGFNKDMVVLIRIRGEEMQNKITAITNEMLLNTNIVSAATAYGVPGMGLGNQVYKVEKDSTFVQQSLNVIYATGDYFETMGYELVAGRDFRKGKGEDELYSYLVNEKAVEVMGWGDEPIGKNIRYFHEDTNGKVIGVVKNFHFQSLHEPIRPMAIVKDDNQGGRLHIKLTGANLPGTLEYIQSVWTKFDQTNAFEYSFLDVEFDRQYKADEIQYALISILSFVCIFISLLGLVGLSAFTAGQKEKEIGIRKALGATVSVILMLLSKDYMKLILVSFIVAVPIANYVFTEWLTNFAFQIDVKWYYFMLPGLFILLIGLITVILQSLKSAKANPVSALRND